MNSAAIAVVGLGFGDEGKGSVVNYLCGQYPIPLVIRYCGGHQVGHTVVDKEKKHVFSNFGSGTLSGVPTYWSKFCTIDPVGIINEIESLTKIDIIPKLFIDVNCPITTPFDKIYNKQTELKNKHGSCGVGFAATVEREENHYSLVFSDLKYPIIFDKKLQMIEEYYAKILNIDIEQIKDLKQQLANFIIACNQLILLKDYIKEGNLQSISFNQTYIFESSQGLLLDQNFGFFPHVTRSNLGSKNIVDILKHEEIEYYLVTRAYQTRHGNGPMTNESKVHNIKSNPNETNVKGKWQGEFRRSLLDLDLIQYGIEKDENIKKSKNKTLVITCLDHIVDEYRFTYKGEIIYSVNEDEFIKKISNILRINNILINNSPDSKTFRKKRIK
jgi:adenylosuccinate synthase